MAGHKKTLITKLYGMSYFGKQGITSRGSERVHNKVMNISFIAQNLESLKSKHLDKWHPIILKMG